MNLSKLDGFGRVKTQTPPQFQGSRKKLKRQARRSGIFNLEQKERTANQQQAAQIGLDTKEWAKDTVKGTALTKRAKRQQKAEKYAKMQGNDFQSGSRPDIGFSRLYQDNQPASEALQGFNRITYTNKELQGLSLQGHTILQGYINGTDEDIEDWDYLLSIEHPATLQGFPTWVLNGKKERQARQARRKAKRAAKDAKKKEKSQKKSRRKNKREERRDSQDARKQRKREVRVAKKEERLQKKLRKREGKQLKKEERQKRKASRIANRAKAKQERQLTRRMKAELRAKSKAERGGQFADVFSSLTDSGMDLASNLLRNDGDFQDFSYNDFESSDFGDFDNFTEGQRLLDDEDALGTRDQALDFMDEIEEDEFILDDPENEGGSSMILPLAAVAAFALMSKKKGKKKKK